MGVPMASQNFVKIVMMLVVQIRQNFMKVDWTLLKDGILGTIVQLVTHSANIVTLHLITIQTHKQINLGLSLV
ncbi:hypothetical protein D3C85_1653120 [compost metagenome]